jgi:hypothetical protein
MSATASRALIFPVGEVALRANVIGTTLLCCMADLSWRYELCCLIPFAAPPQHPFTASWNCEASEGMLMTLRDIYRLKASRMSAIPVAEPERASLAP